MATRGVGKGGWAMPGPYTGQHEKALQEDLAAATAPLSLGPCDPVDPVVAGASMVGKDAM